MRSLAYVERALDLSSTHLSIYKRHANGVVTEQQSGLSSELVKFVYNSFDRKIISYPALFAGPCYYACRPHNWQPEKNILNIVKT